MLPRFQGAKDALARGEREISVLPVRVAMASTLTYFPRNPFRPIACSAKKRHCG
jgi:hypothetical protein